MRTTIAVSVTVKIEAQGDTPEQLISNAALSALEVVEDAVSHRHPQPSDGPIALADLVEHKGVMPDPCHFSIEGATALVNRQAIEAMFTHPGPVPLYAVGSEPGWFNK